MNRKTAQSLLAVALVCAAALPASATESQFTGWVCAIDLPPFSQTLTGDEIYTSDSILECEQEESGTSAAKIECITTLDSTTLMSLGIRKNKSKTFKKVPCRIDATRCNVGLGVLQVNNGKLKINGRNGKATLTCKFEQ